jgi:hypothetical protein
MHQRTRGKVRAFSHTYLDEPDKKVYPHDDSTKDVKSILALIYGDVATHLARSDESAGVNRVDEVHPSTDAYTKLK